MSPYSLHFSLSPWAFSLHNSIAVLEGHFGKRSDFVRTPKFNINALTDTWKTNKYLKKNISANVVFEGIIDAVFWLRNVQCIYRRRSRWRFWIVSFSSDAVPRIWICIF